MFSPDEIDHLLEEQARSILFTRYSVQVFYFKPSLGVCIVHCRGIYRTAIICINQALDHELSAILSAVGSSMHISRSLNRLRIVSALVESDVQVCAADPDLITIVRL